jgi:hypothetical protein
MAPAAGGITALNHPNLDPLKCISWINSNLLASRLYSLTLRYGEG